MTTQENIAKHLNVDIGEPFIMDSLPHTKLHIDANLGVVTQDGDRLSNVMLQELLFGDSSITRIGKRRFYIPHKAYIVSNNFITKEVYDLHIELENAPLDKSYQNTIYTISDKLAKKHKNEIKYIYQFEIVFNECSANTERMQDCCRLDQYFEIMLAYYIEESLLSNLSNVVYNMLAYYVHNEGVSGSKTEEEIKQIIENISLDTDMGETPQDIIKLFNKEVTKNA